MYANYCPYGPYYTTYGIWFKIISKILNVMVWFDIFVTNTNKNMFE